VKVPVLELEAIVTNEGTVRAESPVVPSPMDSPPAGAARFSVTVQLVLAFGIRAAEAHCKAEIKMGCDVVIRPPSPTVE
jgi:hypothetical protein